ncbi:MAG: alpha/beta hydrolase [Candidatus Limnocylindrales bacterium]
MPAEPDSLVVTTDTGDKIHYLDWGGPRGALPPLLLVHGLASTAWIWAPLARQLAAMTHVLAMDLRGHGLSDSPRTGYDLDSLAFDALTVLAGNSYGAEAGGAAAVVAGHGLGALVAATMATAQPASIAGLALVDGGWEDMSDATRMTAAEFERTVGDPPEILASMAVYLTDKRDFDPTTWDTDQERAARAAVDEKHAGHVAPVLRRHALRATVEAMFEYEPAETLGKVAAPLFVAVAESGTGDDEGAAERLLALDDVARARTQAGLPAQRVARFQRTGHNLMRYRPAELAAELAALLEEAGPHQRS